MSFLFLIRYTLGIMIETLSTLFSTVSHTVGATLFMIAMFFGYGHPHPPVTQATTTPTSIVDSIIATSSLETASTTVPVPTKTVVAPVKVPNTIPVVVPPVGAPQPIPTPAVIPIIATTTPTSTIGTTTLAIQSVPLLFGGTAHAGGSVSVSYLQITNVGTEGAVLKGFWLTQNGTALGESIIGLTTVDDTGGLRSSVGGTDGATPFQGGRAVAPTDAYFAPGQMRLFTIKAVMAPDVSAYVGMSLMVDVASIESTAAVTGSFPIRGTTFTIAQ